MCGIVGVISSNKTGFTTVHERIFEQLLFCDTLRGDDSTGVFGVNKYGNVDFLKESTEAPKFMETAEYKKFKNSIFSDYFMLCGHNRKATRGAVSDANAHPFVEQDTILIHNGTLHSYSDLTKEIVTVDSHAILHSLNENGVKETIKKLNGAFALSWYNAKAKEMNLIRNKERPLYIVSTVGAWYFGSELKLLEWILERNNVTIAEITECVPGTLYTFKLEDQDNMWMTPLELYSPKKYTPPTQGAKDIKPRTGIVEEIEPKDFVIGTNLLISKVNIHKVKPNQAGKDRVIEGVWFFDDKVKVRVWTTDEEIEKTIPDIKEDICLFSATLNMVMTKNKNTILICTTPKEYEQTTDSLLAEIFEDEYMLTSKKCSICRKDTTFKEVQQGTFTYKNKDEFHIVCPECTMFEGWPGGYC